MDFRTSFCRWCALRHGSLELCHPCPRYQKHALGKSNILIAHDFCSLCLNRDNDELRIFCERNRFYQADADEDFDCYKYIPAVRGRG